MIEVSKGDMLFSTLESKGPGISRGAGLIFQEVLNPG